MCNCLMTYVGFVIFADEKKSNGGDFALNRRKPMNIAE